MTEEDVGVWTCAALLDDETLESSDTISLIVEGELMATALLPVKLRSSGRVNVSLVNSLQIESWGAFTRPTRLVESKRLRDLDNTSLSLTRLLMGHHDS